MNLAALGRGLRAAGPGFGDALKGFDPRVREQLEMERRIKEAQLAQSDVALEQANQEKLDMAENKKLTPQIAASLAEFSSARRTPDINLKKPGLFAGSETSDPDSGQMSLSPELGRRAISKNMTPLDYLGSQDWSTSTLPAAEQGRKMLGGMQDQENLYGIEKPMTEKEKKDYELRKLDFERDGKIKEAQLKKLEAETAKLGKETPFKGEQYTAATYALRMKQAEEELNDLQSQYNFNPGTFANAVVDNDKFNAIKDPAQRRYAQAMRNYVNAVLRKESGAVISPGEFESANKQYFAQLNDDPATLAQKRRNRISSFAGFRSAAGGAFEEVENRFQSMIGGGNKVGKYEILGEE